MNRKPTVTIGIPAYNEEENIGNLLVSLLRQKQDNFVLEKIIVVSDRSTDNTEKIVEKISRKDKRVKLLVNEDRLGQAQSQNKIKEMISSEISVFLNADILLKSDSFLKLLIKPLILDKKIGLVSPRAETLLASNMFEEIINFSVKLKNAIFEEWKDGHNLYTCKGTARAFRKDFMNQFEWPKLVSEDAFTYLVAIDKDYKYYYQKETNIKYKSPETFKDHRQQSRRFFWNRKELRTLFSNERVDVEFNIPRKIIIKKVLKYFIKNPLNLLSYLFIVLTVKIFPGEAPKHIWEPSISTKNI